MVSADIVRSRFRLVWSPSRLCDSKMNKFESASPKQLAFGTVMFSCFGGLRLGSALEGWLHPNGQFRWIGESLFGLAFVLYGIYWAVLLVRRTSSVR